MAQFTSLKLRRTSNVGMIVDDDNEEEEHGEALEQESSMLIRRHLAPTCESKLTRRCVH